MRILAIETSCDETAIAILEGKNAKPKLFSFCKSALGGKILSNIVASQIKIHAQWGGVVPSLAKREHQRNLLPILKKALKESKLLKISNPPPSITNSEQLSISKQIPKSKLSKIQTILSREPELLEEFLKIIPKIKPPEIDAIAVTIGPGLEPALWVGINFARALSEIWHKPIIGINHMEGHGLSALLDRKEFSISPPKADPPRAGNFQFPIIELLISGGHTELVLLKNPPAKGNWLKYKIIGQTRDDAVGEAFDKVAKMLNLPYPGGPEIAKMAAKAHCVNCATSDVAQFTKLPRPMIDSKDFDFSFSGLKTAVLYLVRNLEKQGINVLNDEKIKNAICAEFQQAAIDVLILKTIKAAEKYKAKTIILGGGVAANKELRMQLQSIIKKNFPHSTLCLPLSKFTGDNAAMIALAAYFRILYSKNWQTIPSKLKANGNLILK